MKWLMTFLKYRQLSRWLVALVLLETAGEWISAGPTCPALSDSQKDSLAAYVHSRYKMSQTVSLNLSREEPVADTCSRKLIFEGKSGVRTWQLVLYLSSDLRFLTHKLYDTTIDPIKEEQLNAEKLAAAFTVGTVPTFGPKDAPVTIVEFSDFQCPYCRRFEQIQKEVLAKDSGQIRIVFHYLPLSMHEWARPAALGAACAMLQNQEAFWELHDMLFENQASITSENISSKLLKYAALVKTIDKGTFRNCLENEMSLGLVLRDINLAASNQITGTPTLFINGRRVQGVKNTAELSSLIEEATASTSRALAPNSNAISSVR
jgi:protein-disulfide isomerase